jgi:hypothetical protein
MDLVITFHHATGVKLVWNHRLYCYLTSYQQLYTLEYVLQYAPRNLLIISLLTSTADWQKIWVWWNSFLAYRIDAANTRGKYVNVLCTCVTVTFNSDSDISEVLHRLESRQSLSIDNHTKWVKNNQIKEHQGATAVRSQIIGFWLPNDFGQGSIAHQRGLCKQLR